MSEEDRVRRARKIAEARYGFRIHFAVYLLVNSGLAVLWYLTGAGFPWPIFLIVFWGIGVAANYMAAYGAGQKWIEKETEKILKENK
jgi:fatty acid desaturase